MYSIKIVWREPASLDITFKDVFYTDGMPGVFLVHKGDRTFCYPWDLIREVKIVHNEEA